MRAWPLLALGVAACSTVERRFPLRSPISQDGDLRSVTAPCHAEPTAKDPAHVSCAPRAYRSPELWDELDGVLFRPLTEAIGVVHDGESVDVNSLDEVPDSSWFVNRLGVGAVSRDELVLGGCDPSLLLDSVGEGDWVIDKGKTSGSSPGFRVAIAGKGKYVFKLDDADQPELSSAATVIAAAAYHAVGYHTTCEQVVYFKPSRLTLMPGLRYKFASFGEERDFDRQALDRILRSAPRRGDMVRMVASAWLPGHLIGPFRYEGTRSDDPNDVVPHEDRRELRAVRVLASWLGHVDTPEKNSMDMWLADRSDQPDSSPGHVVHSFLDWGDSLGSNWPQPEITRRMGFTYIVDWGDIASDFLTLGVPAHPWDEGRAAGHEMFGYFDAARFVPEQWKSEFPNPAFTRMTERDAAWMARILARFTPGMVRALAEAGRFTDPRNTAYVADTLEGRLDRILERYLTRLSSIADVHVEGGNRLCAIDLSEWRGLRNRKEFHYAARTGAGLPLRVARREGGRLCVDLPHIAADGGDADDAPGRYASVAIEDGVSQRPLRLHLYDLGPSRGYQLVGIEREGTTP
ncbi:MAG: hypothetical protein ABSC94_13350 [Polyangiaceae bacterium]|jgi:hypothetical protein